MSDDDVTAERKRVTAQKLHEAAQILQTYGAAEDVVSAVEQMADRIMGI